MWVNKNVIISVKGNQTSNDSDANVIELVTEGKYYKKGQVYFVSYNESEVTGMDGTTTTLMVEGGIVTLMRTGAVNSQFIFQQGQRHVSYYDTAYGSFTIVVYTNEIKVKVDDNGGEISVDYQIEIDNNDAGKNDFYMLIREAGNSNVKYS